MTDRIAEKELLKQTESVCPVCLRRIPAERVARGGDVYLEKICPEHGFFRSVVWRGEPDYRAWGREKIPNPPRRPLTEPQDGCPYDCGFCSAHRQEPCCVLLEVTGRCDLACPVCFASAGEDGEAADPSLEQVRLWYRRMLEAGGPFNIQLSGGEPSLCDDLPQIIATGREMGFTYFQINTNGIRLAQDPDYLARLKEAGLQVVYLQFDGTHDGVFRSLRGRDLLALKEQAIRNCAELNLGVVLVPTLTPGVNDGEVGAIIRFALERYPTVRAIHFQPLCYFGRYPQTGSGAAPTDEQRITIPEILRAAEAQTDGLVHAADFQPKGSENAYCSFHATYVIQRDGSLKPLRQNREQSCCSKPESASEALLRSKSFVARNWPRREEEISAASPARSGVPSLGEWDDFLERARTHLFSISGMVFQDAWSLDLDLLRDCCIATASGEGNLVPFCAWNLTDAAGRPLHRPGNEHVALAAPRLDRA